MRDPLGGINSLWPLFGIANQLLAAVALSVATTILIKMHRWKYMWVTALPTGVAGHGHLHGELLQDLLARPVPRLPGAGQRSCRQRLPRAPCPAAQLAATRAQIFNNQLDAVVCGIFVVLVTLILADSIRIWTKILFGGAGARVGEAPFVLTQLQAGGNMKTLQ